MTSFHAHQLKREAQDRQWVLAAPAPMQTEPPCIPVGTRVIVHSRITTTAVFGTVIGGHGQALRVRTNAGGIWNAMRHRVTVIKHVETWDVLRRAENIFNFRAMNLRDEQFDALHCKAARIADNLNHWKGL